MSNKPVFVATHPRACSTAFERVFMTRRDTLQTVHEPFGDAFYYGPERLSERFENDEKARIESGFADSTYKTIFDRIERENTEGKRVFIKDITYYLFPPNGKPASIAPSLQRLERGVGTQTNGDSAHLKTSVPVPSSSTEVIDHGGSHAVASAPPYPYATAAEEGNPTVVPKEMLQQLHFAFLIRHPKYSVPSYYRCTVPPLDEMTGFYNYMPNEAGYDELRRLFDYLKESGQVGPEVDDKIVSGSGESNGVNGHSDGKVNICVVDADDLLDHPAEIIETFCKSVGIQYTPDMLNWDNEEDHRYAKEAFEKWKGFHEDAIYSSSLKPREHKKKQKTEEEENAEWREKFGEEGAKVIRETVNKNIADYEYLKQFAIKV
ncbi:hypothetical protein H2203_000500 [Taxawa tesnikishii (nom. ined.)]|nr:hypothetical protein H2203_000500 [Dothideales sp. JES 119]